MANPEHLARLRKYEEGDEGSIAWDEWREQHKEILPDLSGANLREMDLVSASLEGADLRDTELIATNLSAAELQGAKLCGANLGAADLTLSDLSEADLTNADLQGADLTDATLDRTNFTGAKVGFAVFARVDLSSAIGLETMEHSSPSSVGIDTIFRSQGKIPREFLRGVGVPEILIKYLPELVGTGIEFYSLFISYSTRDQEFAERLYADLQHEGVRCWFAPHDVKGGRKLHEQIDQAIRVHDKLLLVLSPHSMNSEWVKTEITKARKREAKEGRQVLFPIRLCKFEELRHWECFDADTGRDSAREIREYFIPDFSDWENLSDYKEALYKLLNDLQGKSWS